MFQRITGSPNYAIGVVLLFRARCARNGWPRRPINRGISTAWRKYVKITTRVVSDLMITTRTKEFSSSSLMIVLASNIMLKSIIIYKNLKDDCSFWLHFGRLHSSYEAEPYLIFVWYFLCWSTTCVILLSLLCVFCKLRVVDTLMVNRPLHLLSIVLSL